MESKLIDHIVTEEDLEKNPDWVLEGVEVGEVIEIEAPTEEENTSEEVSNEEATSEFDVEEVTVEVVLPEEKSSENKTVVPEWARLAGEDPRQPIENTLVQDVKKETIVKNKTTNKIPDWANA